MKVTSKRTIAICPDCEEEIDFSRFTPKVGQKLACPYCETNLQVISVDPLEVDLDDSEFFDDDWDSDEDWE